eukprot:GSChrysophyteH1.ASY1.ANO1.3177.1 assembled CDS
MFYLSIHTQERTTKQYLLHSSVCSVGMGGGGSEMILTI